MSKQGDSLFVASNDAREINRALKLIEQRLSNLRGVGQNVELHGANLINVKGVKVWNQASVAQLADNATNAEIIAKINTILKLLKVYDF